MMNDPIANVLSSVFMYDKTGKKELLISPVSSILREVLRILNEQGYVGELESVAESKGGIAKLHLLGNVNKCGVVKPRFSLKSDEFEKFEKRYLPAKGVGVLIVSTSQGIMSHSDAVKKGIGGRLIAYCY